MRTGKVERGEGRSVAHQAAADVDPRQVGSTSAALGVWLRFDSRQLYLRFVDREPPWSRDIAADLPLDLFPALNEQGQISPVREVAFDSEVNDPQPVTHDEVALPPAHVLVPVTDDRYETGRSDDRNPLCVQGAETNLAKAPMARICDVPTRVRERLAETEQGLVDVEPQSVHAVTQPLCRAGARIRSRRGPGPFPAHKSLR